MIKKKSFFYSAGFFECNFKDNWQKKGGIYDKKEKIDSCLLRNFKQKCCLLPESFG